MLSYLYQLKDLNLSNFVFGSEKSFLSFNTPENAFRKYIARSGVKPICIHDLRHSHASLLINKGNNQLSTIYIIAARLGDSADMVLETYGHMFPSSQKDIIDRLNFDF